MIKYILFDFDGTLVDSENVGITIYNELARKYHTKKISDVEKLRGMTLREVIHELQIPFFEIPLIVHDFKKRFYNSVENVKLIPGMKPVLMKLHLTYPLVILSSNKASSILVFLERVGLASIFLSVQGDCSVLGKHRSLKHFIARQKLRPDEVVYIGDEQRDIIAARKAQIPIISVSWGYNSRSLLAASKPDYLIEKPQHLLTTIKKHFS
ncbi:HAD-IA family hydrolase [Candidatus Woesearchaeota archaeon]|nr:HAD-IA family hydrolase [Candidatus Woesearchaeota archaeon]